MQDINEFYDLMDNDDAILKDLKELEANFSDGMSIEDAADAMVAVAAKHGYSISKDSIFNTENSPAEAMNEDEEEVDMACCANQPAENDRKWTGSSWTVHIPDNKSLCDIAIPGTHNSATYTINGSLFGINWGKCQTQGITEQLRAGIRFLDLRVGKGGFLYHEPLCCHITLKWTVGQCVNHLLANNGETILVMISKENNSISDADFRKFCSEAFSPHNVVWHCQKTIPKIGDVRSKLVLVNGSGTGRDGLDLYNPKIFVRQNDWDVGKWTDPWKTRADMKLRLIKEFLKKNFPSTMIPMNSWNKQANVGVSIKTYADYINNAMESTLRYPRGIQVMDYYHQSIVDKIIGSNF